MPTKYIYILFSIFLSFNLTAQSESFKKRYYEALQNLPHNTREAEAKASVLLNITMENNDYEYAKTCFLMGLIEHYNANLYFSNRYFSKALVTDLAKKDKKFAEACYTNMSSNFSILNHLPQAIKYCNKSLQLAEERGDSTTIVRILGNIALLELKEGDFAAAKKKTLHALSYFMKKKDSLSISHYHQNLALIYKDQNMPQKALLYANRALRYLKGKDNYNTIKTLYIIAQAHYFNDDIAASDEILSEALDISVNSPTDYKAITALLYIQLAKNDIVKNSFDRIEDYLAEAKKLSVQSGITENIDEYYYTMSDYYFKKGDYDGYRKNQNEFAQYLERKEKKKSLERYNELKALYGFERKESKIKSQQQELSLKRTQIWGLGAILTIVILASLVVAYYYVRLRAYIKHLYDSNVNKTSEAPFPVIKDDGHDKIVSLYNSLIDLMEKEKLYLQPGLSISDLSERLATNDKYMSQAINICSESNFNAFINKYRTNYAQKILIANGTRVPLKAVSAEAGFSSPATFYRQFKEYTGLTPGQFMEISEKNLNKQLKD